MTYFKKLLSASLFAGCSKIVSLFTILIISKYLTLTNFGFFSLILALVAFVEKFTSSGIIQYVNSNTMRYKKLLEFLDFLLRNIIVVGTFIWIFIYLTNIFPITLSLLGISAIITICKVTIQFRIALYTYRNQQLKSILRLDFAQSLIFLLLTLVVLSLEQNIEFHIIEILLICYLVSFLIPIFLSRENRSLTGKVIKLKKWRKNYKTHKNEIKKISVFYGIGMTSVASTELSLIITSMTTSLDVTGLLRIALLFSGISTLIMTLSNRLIMPKVREYLLKNDILEVQKLVKLQTNTTSSASILILIIFALFSKHFLNIYYPEQSDVIYGATLILLLGQTVNCLCGPVGMLLNMTQNHFQALRINLFGTITLIFITPFFGYAVGIYGIASCIAVVVGLVNLLRVRFVYEKLRIRTWAHL